MLGIAGRLRKIAFGSVQSEGRDKGSHCLRLAPILAMPWTGRSGQHRSPVWWLVVDFRKQ